MRWKPLTAQGHLRDGSAILAKPCRKAELARRLREALSAPLQRRASGLANTGERRPRDVPARQKWKIQGIRLQWIRLR
jgi:hypothetical protein